jgi:hypothetical protein
MSPSQHSNGESDFYVGYMPTPDSHKRFLTKLIAFLCIGIVAIGVLIASAQRNPGKSDTVSPVMATWSGTVYMNPYPMLVHDDGSIHLLIGIGKFGVQDRVSPFDAMRCEVDGWELARTDRKAIQLDVSENAIREAEGPAKAAPKLIAINNQTIELVGEIVDGKCFLGAMKPGDGKAHKACATLCIQGGLPPMFASNPSSTTAMLPLILIDGSTHVPHSVLALVGEPVQLTGKMSTIGSLNVLHIKSDSVHRWSGDTP